MLKLDLLARSLQEIFVLGLFTRTLLEIASQEPKVSIEHLLANAFWESSTADTCRSSLYRRSLGAMTVCALLKNKQLYAF